MATTDWTSEEKLQALMRLPWSVKLERDPRDGSLIAQVDELPDAIATGDNEQDLARDLWEAIEASLACRLEYGDPLPLPQGNVIPWEGSAQPSSERPNVRQAKIQLTGEVWTRPFSTVNSGAVASLGV